MKILLIFQNVKHILEGNLEAAIPEDQAGLTTAKKEYKEKKIKGARAVSSLH